MNDERSLSAMPRKYTNKVTNQRTNHQPLLAICRDCPDDPEGFYYTVYFINQSPHSIHNLYYSASGFTSMDDEFVQTSTHHKLFGTVPPMSAITIENDSEYGFEYINNYHFSMEINGQSQRLIFSSPKYLRDLEEVNVPILNKLGMIL
jgi:hypothetical protein